MKAPIGQRDAVVAKIRTDGTKVLWATYLGGSQNEWGEGSIRVDKAGDVYFLTVTNSSDIPTTAGAFDRTYNGGWDFYLAKLNTEGSLVYGTYLGGSGNEHIETHELAIDVEGNAIIASGTTSADFPIAGNAFQKTYAGSGGSGTGARTNYPGDIIVAKLSADGSQLLASTFIGGRYGEAVEGIGLDKDGNVCLSGATFSDNFPVTRNAFQPTKKGKVDAFAVILSADFSRASLLELHGWQRQLQRRSHRYFRRRRKLLYLWRDQLERLASPTSHDARLHSTRGRVSLQVSFSATTAASSNSYLLVRSGFRQSPHPSRVSFTTCCLSSKHVPLLLCSLRQPTIH